MESYNNNKNSLKSDDGEDDEDKYEIINYWIAGQHFC